MSHRSSMETKSTGSTKTWILQLHSHSAQPHTILCHKIMYLDRPRHGELQLRRQRWSEKQLEHRGDQPVVLVLVFVVCTCGICIHCITSCVRVFSSTLKWGNYPRTMFFPEKDDNIWMILAFQHCRKHYSRKLSWTFSPKPDINLWLAPKGLCSWILREDVECLRSSPLHQGDDLTSLQINANGIGTHMYAISTYV